MREEAFLRFPRKWWAWRGCPSGRWLTRLKQSKYSSRPFFLHPDAMLWHAVCSRTGLPLLFQSLQLLVINTSSGRVPRLCISEDNEYSLLWLARKVSPKRSMWRRHGFQCREQKQVLGEVTGHNGSEVINVLVNLNLEALPRGGETRGGLFGGSQSQPHWSVGGGGW